MRATVVAGGQDFAFFYVQCAICICAYHLRRGSGRLQAAHVYVCAVTHPQMPLEARTS